MDRSSVCTASEPPARSCPRWPTSRPCSGTPARAHARWRARSAALNAPAARTDPAPNQRERPTQRRVSHMGLRRTAFASGPQVKRPGFPLRHGAPRKLVWQCFMKRLCASHGARTPSFASGIPALAATESGRSCYRAATQPRDSQDKSPANPFALFAAPEPQNACSRLHFRGGSYLRPLIGETGFEPATARPPAGCATRLRHSPWQKQAGDGNRTRPRSLEGFCAATTLRPHAQDPILPACPARRARPEAEQAKPPPSEAPGPAKAQGATAATATATVAPPPGPRRHRPPALPGATGRTSCRGRRPVSPPSR